MASKPRIVLALVLCLLAAGVIATARWASRRTEERIHESATATHGDCRQCHEAVFGEWEASFHSRAWADVHVQAAFEHFGFDRKCQSCHAPRPVLVTGLAAQVELRQQDPEPGVHCLSCHRTADGRGVAARRTIPDAPCRPVQTPELTTSRFCGTCHEAIYDDWVASRFREQALTCQQCHMRRGDDPEGPASHLCRGGHDPATVRSGLRMECRREGDELIVALVNETTGHNYPGERHHRVLSVRVIERTPAGEIVLAQKEVIKDVTPFRGESSAEQIRAGQTAEARFPIVQTPVTAEVRLLYKTFPWLTDRDALEVDRADVKLERP
jgi:hypothetical protein